MMTLSKVFPVLVSPLGFALILLLFLGALSWKRRNSFEALCAFTALAILWISGTPAFSTWVFGNLESQFPPVPIAELPSADAIVVLGGGLGLPFPPRMWIDLDDASDRVLHAARLYRARKAPLVIATGGQVFPQKDSTAHSEAAAEMLTEWGVPAKAILLDRKARNTFEEAEAVRELADQHKLEKFLLVTSAFHMRRAQAVFVSAGLDVTPATTDIRQADYWEPLVLRHLPNAKALERTTSALREHLGYWGYRFRGWIQ